MQLGTAKKVIHNIDNIKKVYWNDYSSFIKRFNLKPASVQRGYVYYTNESKSKELLKPTLKSWAFISDSLK